MRSAILIVAAALVAVTLVAQTERSPSQPARPEAVGPSMFDALTTATRRTGVQLASMECPHDLRGCTSPREHVRNFKAGKYGYARKDIFYSRVIRRRILEVARAAWYRKYPNRRWRPRYRWIDFTTAGDRCIVSTYGTRTNTCIQQQNEAFRRYNVVLKRVVICGVQLVPIFKLKTVSDRLLPIAGSTTCAWAYADPDV